MPSSLLEETRLLSWAPFEHPWGIRSLLIWNTLQLGIKTVGTRTIEVYTCPKIFSCSCQRHVDSYIGECFRELHEVLQCHKRGLSRYRDHHELWCFGRSAGSSSRFVWLSCKKFEEEKKVRSLQLKSLHDDLWSYVKFFPCLRSTQMQTPCFQWLTALITLQEMDQRYLSLSLSLWLSPSSSFYCTLLSGFRERVRSDRKRGGKRKSVESTSRSRFLNRTREK